jgi:hypothetical protein
VLAPAVMKVTDENTTAAIIALPAQARNRRRLATASSEIGRPFRSTACGISKLKFAADERPAEAFGCVVFAADGIERTFLEVSKDEDWRTSDEVGRLVDSRSINGVLILGLQFLDIELH